MIEAGFGIARLSSIYETEPVGMDSDLKFLNMVAEVEIPDIRPSQMMARLLRIEYLLEREYKGLKRPRTIDLDVLFFGEQIIDTELLTVPHPRLHLRKFVLCPLAEIAPTFIHPQFGVDIVELLRAVEDNSEVKRWDPNQLHAPALAANS